MSKQKSSTCVERAANSSHDTLVDALYAHSQALSDAPLYSFIRDVDEDIASFRQIALRVNATASILRQRADAGDRALLVYTPSIDFIVAFVACLQAGVIAVPCYPPGKNIRSFGAIANIVADCRPRLVLTTEAMLPTLLSHMGEAGLAATLDTMCTDVITAGRYEDHVRGSIDPASTAFIQYTSGSTGAPKGVMVSHRNIVSNLEVIREKFGHSSESRGVIWLPPYHDMGLIGGILQPLYVGFPVKLMAPITFVQKPLRWLQTVSDFRATTSGGPNFAYQLCTQKIQAEEVARLDLSAWRVAFNGAEPISPEVLRRFASKFAASGFREEAFYPCYGRAEATLLVSGGVRGAGATIRSVDADLLTEHRVKTPAADVKQQLVACGYRADQHEVLIVDPDTRRVVEKDHVGEIWVSGPSVAQGYWCQEERTQEVFHARLIDRDDVDWLRTGDLGFFDDDGQLYIAGRQKDLIIIRGRNYHPQDIEATVESAHDALHPGRGAAFSVVIDDDERLVVVHEVKRDQIRCEMDAVIDAIRRAVTQHHELQAYAIVLLKPAALPLTTSGKVKRWACRAGFLGEKLGTIAHWKQERSAAAERPAASTLDKPRVGVGSAAAIEAWLKDAVAQQLELRSDEIDRTRQFADFGLDSLHVAAISGELVDWLEFRVPPEIFSAPGTITSVSRYLGAAHDLGKSLELLPTSERHLLLESLTESHSLSDRFGGKPIPVEFSDFQHSSAYVEFERRQQQLFKGQGRSPFFTVHEGLNSDETVIGGRTYVNYSCNNFLALSGHPQVSAAAADAIHRYGTSVSASRLVSGERPLHLQLEQALADWIGVESALVFVGAATANVSCVGHLMGPNDLVLFDELSHNSLIQGIRLSHADSQPFRHNDYGDLDSILARKRLPVREGACVRRGPLQHGRRHAGPCQIHRGKETSPVLADGGRMPVHRRDRSDRSRHRRAVRRQSGRCGDLDGRYQQGLSQLWWLCRRQAFADPVSQIHHPGVHLYNRHFTGQRGSCAGGAASAARRSGDHPTPTPDRRAFFRARGRGRPGHRPFRGWTDRTGHYRRPDRMHSAIPGAVRAGHQRPADRLSGGCGERGAPTFLLQRNPYG